MYMDKEEGVALQADNGNYWSCISYDSGDQKIYIEAAKEHKDSWCKFHVSKTSDDKILLQDKRGMYLSRYCEDDIQYIKPVKSSPDECCEFRVFTDDAKILLRADNGLYLSRIYRKHQNIEAAKEGPDESCRFAVSIGDVVEPSFQILNVEVKDSSEHPKVPTAVAVQSYTNKTSVAQSHTFKLSWEVKNTETTTWTNAWGFSSSLSSQFKLLDFEVTVSYNGSVGKTSSIEKTSTVAEETTVAIPPGTKVDCQLMVVKDDNAIIPFKATIKKTDPNGVETIFTEEGTWNGVCYTNVNIVASEEAI
ncbi:AEP1 protein, partial [Polypterus senegalus]